MAHAAAALGHKKTVFRVVKSGACNCAENASTNKNRVLESLRGGARSASRNTFAEENDDDDDHDDDDDDDDDYDDGDYGDDDDAAAAAAL